MKDIPAFPQPINPREQGRGMSLRDYFAAKAMQGLLASEVNAGLKAFAKQSYVMADAMMEARNAAQ
jgi:hypothetical protein